MQTYIRLEKGVKNALQKIADTEHRTLSNLIQKIVIDWLKEKGIDYKKEKPFK